MEEPVSTCRYTNIVTCFVSPFDNRLDLYVIMSLMYLTKDKSCLHFLSLQCLADKGKRQDVVERFVILQFYNGRD